MAPDYHRYDRRLWLFVCVTLLAAHFYNAREARALAALQRAQASECERNQATEVKQRADREARNNPENAIPLDTLRTLIAHPDVLIRTAAQKILLDRFTRTSSAALTTLCNRCTSLTNPMPDRAAAWEQWTSLFDLAQDLSCRSASVAVQLAMVESAGRERIRLETMDGEERIDFAKLRKVCLGLNVEER